MLDMSVWVAAKMQHGWALKDQVRASTTVDGVLAIDVEAGWPA